MDLERARELVARERARIEAALADLEIDSDDELSHVDQHVADTGSELFDKELGATERAERRIAEGTYGQSVESGEPIPDARLEALPLAERTVEEQARLEGGL
jgi:DnaK suppressor protein